MKTLLRNVINTFKEDLTSVRRANRDKETALRRANREKELAVRQAEQEKEQMKRQADREKEMQKRMDKGTKESIISNVVEYIKSDGMRRRCDGGDGRRTENPKKEKKEKDEVKSGGDKAYNAFFDKKLKKYGVSSPDELSGEEKKKFYNEIDREWKADNEED